MRFVMTYDQWNALKPGDTVTDSWGYQWRVTRTRPFWSPGGLTCLHSFEVVR